MLGIINMSLVPGLGVKAFLRLSWNPVPLASVVVRGVLSRVSFPGGAAEEKGLLLVSSMELNELLY